MNSSKVTYNGYISLFYNRFYYLFWIVCFLKCITPYDALHHGKQNSFSNLKSITLWRVISFASYIALLHINYFISILTLVEIEGCLSIAQFYPRKRFQHSFHSMAAVRGAVQMSEIHGSSLHFWTEIKNNELWSYGSDSGSS